MSDGKYIRFKNIDGARDIVVLFDPLINHSDMARAFGGKENVVSAGFVSISDNGRLSCYGKSVSLNTESKDTDSDLANRRFGVDYIY